jgi:phage terminase large subunit-like protein
MAVVEAPVWSGYAAGSEIDHFSGFCSEYLIQSEDRWDGLPLDLGPFQVRMMGEALAYDEKGQPVWKRVVFLMPRKNGKTALLAAYAVYRLLTSDGSPEILLAASSDKQAGKLFSFAARYIHKNPELEALARVREHAGEIARLDGEGMIIRMSSDPRRLHGYGPSLVICDELAQWTTPQLQRAYAALTSGHGARSTPQVFTITTAGDAQDRESSVLGRILDAALSKGTLEERPGLTIARQFDAGTLVYNHQAPTMDPYDVKKMKLANPAPWITEEFLREQAENDDLTDAEVLQLHGCVWAQSERHWLPAGAWDKLVKVRKVKPGEKIVLAFDGSYRRDSTALVGITLEDRHIWVEGAWERPEKADDWVVPRGEVKLAVDRAMEKYRVVEFACDPPGWHQEIEEWGERYGDVVTIKYETNRRKLMIEACSRFFTAVVNADLSHDGNADLARHLANAVRKDTPDGAYISKDHPDSPRKIDLAVAAIIAHDRAVLFEPAKPRLAYSW